MKFVSGVFDTGPAGMAGWRWRPCAGQPVPMEGPAQVWAAGYDTAALRYAPALGGSTEVFTAGVCLATKAELWEARDSAERGRWEKTPQLPGSFLSVVRTGETVRVAGDRAGTICVFWLVDGDEVVWSTSAIVLAAYAGAAPNPVRLVAAFTLVGVDPLGTHSYFAGIHRVPPGHALVLSPGRPVLTEAVPTPRSALGFEEGALALRETMTTAVERRIGLLGPASADLSGGIDSSILTALAACRAPLTAITYTDGYMRGEDDLLYARRFAADFPDVRHVTVDGEQQGVLHFDGLQRPDALVMTDSPSLSIGVLGIKAAHLAPAVASDARFHLTGRGGDDVLDSPVPAMAVDLYQAGQRRAAAARVTAYARTLRSSPPRFLRHALQAARTTYPQALSAMARTLAGPSTLPGGGHSPAWEAMDWCSLSPVASWLTPDGRTALAGLLGEDAGRVHPERGPGALHERLALERMGEEHATYDQIADQSWGIPIHAPYLDTAVVNVCHAIPGWQRRHVGDFKPLARAALSGIAPEYLLQRRTKTAHTGSVYAGIRRNEPALRTILTHSRILEEGLLAPAPVIAALEGAARGEPAPLAGLHALVAAECWLASLTVRRDLFWERTPVAEEAR
ncbi:asparagine synthase-related protein [Streptomyces sp. H27-H5]|uniref:asparagine synthase-related protein n=1 Tax=Streptomyces sp. H27-H5 TaxID=2996460 RepID=UPI0022721691|nr:asparagine synthase-related protein [Streptomyces sp. H27-H5]MCY0961632.1 asparagine synthase-related protein [Streptomyces sp. H27-H5]